MVAQKIFILLCILIGCSIVCYFIGWIIGGLIISKKYKSSSILLIVLVSLIGCIPVVFYLPELPPVPEGSEDPKPWIILASMTMNAYLVMLAIVTGIKKRPINI